MTDVIGLTTYVYHPIGTPPALGAGQLANVDGPLNNDTVAFGYDELGRLTSRTIDGIGSAVAFDSLGRIRTASNPLGNFGYFYVGATSRLDYVTFPNATTVDYDYLDGLHDRRLGEIKNVGPGNSVISKFNYLYDTVGQITDWTIANSGMASPQRFTFGYDPAGQLRTATLNNASTNAVLKQYAYNYDPAGNRLSEQIDSAVTGFGVNALNQLTSQGVGGSMLFNGSINEPGTVSINGSPASVDSSLSFSGTAPVVSGTNVVSITATDTAGQSRTSQYSVVVPNGLSRTMAYDLNGNMTDDGAGRTFEWDAVNRLLAVNLASGDRTEFAYDGFGRRVRITEKSGGAILSDKRYLWNGAGIAEERNSGNTTTKRYYNQGVQAGGTSNYYYSRDHLGSVREMLDSGGNVQARYDYDPYGRRTRVSGTVDSEFGFTGHLYHVETGLHLTMYRGYDAGLGRWLSRDPIGESGGLNLYGYVGNNPVLYVDPLGLVRWGDAGRAGLGVVVNWIGLGVGFGLAAVPEPTLLTKVAAVAVTTKSGYGLGANLTNFWSALRDECPGSTGSLAGDVADAIAPGNETAQDLAAVADLSADLATGRISANHANKVVGALDRFAMERAVVSDPAAVSRASQAFIAAEVGRVGVDRMTK